MEESVLIEEFEKEIILNITKMKVVNYTPKIFIRMIGEYGCYKASKKLISQREMPEGFKILLLKGRVDLSIENLVVNPKYIGLFTENEISICKERLSI